MTDSGKVVGYESDYIESSDPGSYLDTSGESDADDARRHKSSMRYYDTNVPLDDFFLDLRFQQLKLFKEALLEYSTRKGFEFTYVKNDALRVRAKCAAKGCNWLVLCSWCSGKKMFVVKHYVSEHSCLGQVTRNKRVTAHVVVKKFGDIIVAMPFIRPRHLKAMVRKDLGVFISTKVCRNAKSLVIKQIEQQFRDDFRVLTDYALELRVANPGSNVLIVFERQAQSTLPVFQRMYICLSAIREGFLAGCRRLIGVDGCFLKGLMKGQLFVAVGRDGNNQMFPIAWAVVEKETTESWTWFLQQLQADLCIGEGLGWALTSDMQKGLLNAVNTLFPLIEHRMCARHIYARWGKQFPGKEMQLHFWNTARATCQPEMQRQLQSMRKVKGGEKAVEVLLERWPISNWCQAFFSDVIKCDVIDNNMCETFNGVLLEARGKPIISMLEDIRKYVMNRVVVKREYAVKWTFDLGPNIIAKLEKERNKCVKWHIEWNGAASHEVSWNDQLLQVRESHVVRLPDRSCSCGKWDKSGIPCQHALAAISYQGGDPLTYVAEWFTKDTYLRAYQYTINPLRGRMFWETSPEGPLLPPIPKRMPGRPAKKRKREPLEGKNKSKTKLSRSGRVFKCGICHKEGHNRVKCMRKASNVTYDAVGSSGREPQGKNRKWKEKGVDSVIASNINPSGQKSEQSNKRKGKEKGRSDSATIDNIAPTGQRTQQGRRKKGTELIDVASEHKRASFKVLKGAHTGEVILGREVAHGSSFMTSSELLALSSRRIAARENKNKEANHQASAAFETLDISTTQQSMIT